jgi:hypothetical protein
LNCSLFKKGPITSLEEQVKVRVTSVENGRKFQNSKRGEATMPDGATELCWIECELLRSNIAGGCVSRQRQLNIKPLGRVLINRDS